MPTDLDAVILKLRDHTLNYGEQDEAFKLVEALRDERDLWKARAFVLFWRLPDEAVLPITKSEVEKAKAILGLVGR